MDHYDDGCWRSSREAREINENQSGCGQTNLISHSTQHFNRSILIPHPFVERHKKAENYELVSRDEFESQIYDIRTFHPCFAFMMFMELDKYRITSTFMLI